MRLDTRSVGAWIVVGALLGCSGETAGSAGAGSTGSGEAASPAAPVLAGEELSLVVVGYSTSYAWPAMLQQMLDQHAGGGRLYHVLNAVVGGSPVGRWIAPPGSEDYEATYGAMRRDFFGPEPRLLGDAPPPTVAIIQQSLQRTPTPATRLGPVSGADDLEGIAIGADALERLVDQLRQDGIDRTVIAMHIYKPGYEPEVGNERFALAELLARGHADVFGGPDLWSATLREHPAAFAEDGLHPNGRGAKLMAEAWYRTLAGEGARQEIVDALHAEAHDADAMTEAYLAWRRGDPPPAS